MKPITVDQLEIINLLKHHMWSMACYRYNNMYSSDNCVNKIHTHRVAASTLLDLCNDLNIDVATLKASYFNIEVNIYDLNSVENIVGCL